MPRQLMFLEVLMLIDVKRSFSKVSMVNNNGDCTCNSIIKKKAPLKMLQYTKVELVFLVVTLKGRLNFIGGSNLFLLKS